MRKIMMIVLMFISVMASAQSLMPDMHHCDSTMALLQQRYDPYHLLRVDSAKQQSIVVLQYGPLKVDHRAVNFPGIWVPDPPGIFEEQDERQWMMEDHTFGEEVFHGVLNILSDIVSSKKSKKRR